MHLVTLGEQQFREITAILSGNARDQCLLQKILLPFKIVCSGTKSCRCMLAASGVIHQLHDGRIPIFKFRS
jgi:hypothetical protein